MQTSKSQNVISHDKILLKRRFCSIEVTAMLFISVYLLKPQIILKANGSFTPAVEFSLRMLSGVNLEGFYCGSVFYVRMKLGGAHIH